MRCALPPTGNQVADAAGLPPCDHNTRFPSQPGTSTSTAHRSEKETRKPKAGRTQPPIRLECHLANTTPGSLRNVAQIHQRPTAAKRKHESPKPAEHNHRCGWTATLRTQHQVPFATWHKYVNGQPQRNRNTRKRIRPKALRTQVPSVECRCYWCADRLVDWTRTPPLG